MGTQRSDGRPDSYWIRGVPDCGPPSALPALAPACRCDGRSRATAGSLAGDAERSGSRPAKRGIPPEAQASREASDRVTERTQAAARGCSVAGGGPQGGGGGGENAAGGGDNRAAVRASTDFGADRRARTRRGVLQFVRCTTHLADLCCRTCKNRSVTQPSHGGDTKREWYTCGSASIAKDVWCR